MSLNKSIKITALVATFNSEKYLERSIQSFLSQDYDNKELIIIDGGSRDSTLEIIRKYERFISYWESKQDKGMYHAHNKGILHSNGDLLIMMDSDDVYFSDHVYSSAVHAAELNPDAMLIYGDAVLISSSNPKMNKPFNAKKTTYKELAQKRCFIPSQAAFFRKDVVPIVGMLNTSYKYAADWEYWIRILKKFNSVFVNEYWGCWRIHGENATIKKESKYYVHFIENIKISLFYGRNPFSKIILLNLYICIIYYLPFKKQIKRIFYFMRHPKNK